MSRVIELIDQYPQTREMPCAVMHFIAAISDAQPQVVAECAATAGKKVTACQLGVFGYGKKELGRINGRQVKLTDAVLDAIGINAKEGVISCAALWQIAADFKVNRAEIGNAADSLGLKIGRCQLGIF